MSKGKLQTHVQISREAIKKGKLNLGKHSNISEIGNDAPGKWYAQGKGISLLAWHPDTVEHKKMLGLKKLQLYFIKRRKRDGDWPKYALLPFTVSADIVSTVALVWFYFWITLNEEDD